jgi:hypothetical protein
MRMRLVVSLVAVAAAVGVAALEAGANAAPAAASHTVKVVVRPVTASGHARSGFAVKAERNGLVDCSFPDASPGAVNKNILLCSPSAEYAIACWKAATPHRVLCLRNPRSHRLARIPRQGKFAHAARPSHKNSAPLLIVLGDGAKCSIRDGGAWGTLHAHPNWVGAYSCTRDGDVWAPPKSHHNGVNESKPVWTVHTAASSGKGPVTVRTVRRAYFVGTAH